MTRREWDIEREKVTPNTAQSNFTRASGSQARQRHERLMFLKYGHVATVIATSHRDVIEKAVRDGQPVPPEILAEYTW